MTYIYTREWDTDETKIMNREGNSNYYPTMRIALNLHKYDLIIKFSLCNRMITALMGEVPISSAAP